MSLNRSNNTSAQGRPADQPIVHLVDDDPLLRDVAAHVLQTSGYQVIQHQDGDAFLQSLPAAPHGCILLDLNMPGRDGREVMIALAEARIDWPTVVLTAEGEVRTAVEAMKAGAIEYLIKPFDPEALVSAISLATEKLQAASEEVEKARRAVAAIAGLSPRETEVLQGLLAGLPNKLIAYELDLSVRTVELYRGKLMDKLGVRSVSSAVRLALSAGLEPLALREE